MSLAAIVELVTLGIGLVKSGLLAYAEVKGVLAKYKEKEATAENIEAARQELLAAAKIPQAVDDPQIRTLLEEIGVDPETLRIGS
ncbi:MAG: hypothetical protein HY713_00730 [candidate division NC10 bacterium]|nr:hypothetical protein [candidate division NC10 bacterium]